jgi:hypothetical protein
MDKGCKRRALVAPLVIVAAGGLAGCSHHNGVRIFTGSRTTSTSYAGGHPLGLPPITNSCIAIGSAPVNMPPPTECHIAIGKVAVTDPTTP